MTASPAYAIRSAAEADIDTLVAFTIQEAAEAEGVTLSVEQATAGVGGAFASPARATYWVAVDADGAIVASTSIVKEWSNFRGGDYWWIQSVFVAPAHRGRGLVDRLIEHLAAESKAAGALDLRLYVHRNNPRAAHVYERLGFVEAPYSIMRRS